MQRYNQTKVTEWCKLKGIIIHISEHAKRENRVVQHHSEQDLTPTIVGPLYLCAHVICQVWVSTFLY